MLCHMNPARGKTKQSPVKEMECHFSRCKPILRALARELRHVAVVAGDCEHRHGIILRNHITASYYGIVFKHTELSF